MAPTIYRCKLHNYDHAYTVCLLCGCQYCPQYWPTCPRVSGHAAHLAPHAAHLAPADVNRIVDAPTLRGAIVHLLEIYTPQAIVAELKGAINDQAERQEFDDTRQQLRNLAAMLPSVFPLGGDTSC
jgi:hypothetical protein